MAVFVPPLRRTPTADPTHQTLQEEAISELKATVDLATEAVDMMHTYRDRVERAKELLAWYGQAFDALYEAVEAHPEARAHYVKICERNKRVTALLDGMGFRVLRD